MNASQTNLYVGVNGIFGNEKPMLNYSKKTTWARGLIYKSRVWIRLL